MTKKPLLRERHEHEHARVTYVELFFDLVFVFAVTQLSHAVIGHPTGLGLLHAGLLLLAVWWAWVFTAWVTNWMDPERTRVRVMLFVLMAAGLVLSAAIPDAFGKRGLVFACAYVFIQVGRSLFFLVGVWREPAHRLNFIRILAWLSLSAVFWIAGAFQQGEARLLIWAVAMAIEYASPAMGFWTPGLGRSSSTDWVVEGGHLAERCALFTIRRVVGHPRLLALTGAKSEPSARRHARSGGVSHHQRRGRLCGLWPAILGQGDVEDVAAF